ncbi:MAG: UDP-glucose 4-epimerase GalE [Hyphomicrobiales bacterium]|nr:UDP-glucose 4-epimerase GalE [Hyphomicrobiales bacterium]
MTVLVIGGAGYVGSHMVKRLLEHGETVVTLDDFSKGFPDAILGGPVVRGDYGDAAVLNAAFAEHKPDAVMLFASFIEVGESVAHPAKYYVNNVAKCFTLLEAMVRHGVRNLVFSSSAAVYGSHDGVIREDAACRPLSPYGRTKWIVEQALRDFSAAYKISFFALRYFNASGASPDGRIGERHDPETHLIPLVLQAASKRRADIKVFGRDYPTPDGTCLRDYVHVEDLCHAHLLALRALRAGAKGGFYNLGNARGYSVAEVIDVAREVTGRDITVVDAPRRPGDPAMLVADSTLIREELGWRPQYGDLRVIVEHAWAWERLKGERW